MLKKRVVCTKLEDIGLITVPSGGPDGELGGEPDRFYVYTMSYGHSYWQAKQVGIGERKPCAVCSTKAWHRRLGQRVVRARKWIGGLR